MSKREDLEALGYKAYENDNIIVYWRPNSCIHAGRCVSLNNQVFDPRRRPWIDLSKASAIEIAKIIDNCPSKALQCELKFKIEFIDEELKSIAKLEDVIVGECDCIVKEDKWAITHTEVKEGYEGRGIAKLLVENVIENAKKNNMKINPICSYAKKLIESNERYSDIL